MSKDDILSRDKGFMNSGLYYVGSRFSRDIVSPFLEGFKEKYN
jgi:hypothetical protein